MADNWSVLRFGDLCYHSAFGPRFSSNEYSANGNVACLRTMDITANGEINLKAMPLAQLDANRFSQHFLEPDDLVITRTGAYLGKVAVFEGFRLPVLAGAFLIRFQLDSNALRPQYSRYYFNSPMGQRQIQSIVTGSVQPNLNITNLHTLEIPVPPIAVQERIVEIVKTLDDKIESNRRMNQTLEAMARALFKSWFIDFDPVHANAAGQPTLPRDLAALFPSEFEPSKLGNVPKGWEIKPVGEAVECVGGGTPSTKRPEYWEDGTHHWATPKDLSALTSPVLTKTARKLTDSGISKISSGLLAPDTVLLSSRAPVGYLAISTVPVAINQGFIALKPTYLLPPPYLLLWCAANMDTIKGQASGTTFAEISKKAFRPIPMLVPSLDVTRIFAAFVEPLYKRITENVRESGTLAALRESLLPRLLSGELDARRCGQQAET